ncbi:MAG: 6-carboxytetrahydropterin synthase QueD [Flavobacteriales bacterium CG_4_9_14_0_2_um_filter_35_242]|nr:6-carboxytetrahydropterin synthase [Zetaproteobacteria bacterium]OIO12107.1 MAG: 6-carboxytetrahydropterin synthase QueD [Flavobacteriaceae bacterium CG1_02_35_72]PIV18907.1 MAG: 6-carboxytetrahydropterin synthase QueD [Flavobacteriales bacterium CG03_land_8_20_14_0_80_35_15]PJA05810.1 MAG: 6-carboxytetrahydropterin synthase QueD [Flavobacteriales bacterium CG_4_10_14_0_2_um_filter_35_18]PJC58950.1 MAG: 6-carboxytetrahydropterin synthase QueD [Flavobacteriales bacterium CG_4_9_14_0_2_um_filt
MSTIRITKHFDFETAHALYGYDGKCKNIHGHSYQLFVTLIGTPINDPSNVKHGMVMDFGELKALVNREIISKFDHTTVLNNLSPHKDLANTLSELNHHVVLVDYQPTSENMLLDFAKRINHKLPINIKLHSLKLYETANSYAEWFADDNL